MPGLVFPVAGFSWADFRDRLELRGAGTGEPGRGGWRYRRSETHVHRGIDLKAPIGTAVLAVEDGRAEFIKAVPGKGGGHRVRLHGVSGAAYHYLHLGTDPTHTRDAFPAEFADIGDRAVEVTAGTVIGYLGHTGGAVATRTPTPIPASAAHLHFQYHPYGADSEDADPAVFLELIAAEVPLDGRAG